MRTRSKVALVTEFREPRRLAGGRDLLPALLGGRRVHDEHELARFVRRGADDVRGFLCRKQFPNASCLQSATLRLSD